MIEIKTLFEKISPEYDDPFWYHNEQIAVVEFEDGDRLWLESRGEIQVYLDEDGIKYKGSSGPVEAMSRGYTDKDLAELSKHDGWIFNNWFVVWEEDGDDLAVCHSYDEGIQMLKKITIKKATEKVTVLIDNMIDDFDNMTSDSLKVVNYKMNELLELINKETYERTINIKGLIEALKLIKSEEKENSDNIEEDYPIDDIPKHDYPDIMDDIHFTN